MKSFFKTTSILVLAVFLSLSVFISCGKDSDRKVVAKKSNEIKTNGTKSFPESGPVSVVKYKTPAGADPSISAEDGGNGFEDIAGANGWKTNTKYKSQGDPKAKKGGFLKMAMLSYPKTFRCYGKDENGSAERMIYGLVYESLLTIDVQTMDYKPILATHWKIEEDKMTYWFRINPEARWNDGKPVTSDDVVATWELATDAGILAPYTNELYSKYEKPVAISKYIVKVKSKVLSWNMFMYFSGMSILPKHHLDKVDGASYLLKYNFKMMPGTGPYIVDEKKTKNEAYVTLRRRSDYWRRNDPKKLGENNFDEFKMVVIRDETLTKEKFKKGDIDFYIVPRAQWWVNEFDTNNKSFDFLNRGLIQKKKVYNFSPKGHGGLAFNMRKAPFDDIRIRKAFAHLWNIKQLNEKLFFNEYVKLNSTWPFSVYENPENKRYEYSPKKANKLLDEAGWSNKNEQGIRLNKNGEPFIIEMAIQQSNERIFTPLQEDLKKAGIQLDLKVSDPNTMWNMLQERRFKMHYASWGAIFFPNPESSLHSSLADKNATNNSTGFKNKRVDEICEAYKTMFDPKERVKAIQEIDKILSETVHYAYGWTAPYASGGRFGYWNKFGMPESVFSYSGDWRDIPTLWWYEPEMAEKVEKAKLDKSIKFPHEEVEVDYWNNRGK